MPINPMSNNLNTGSTKVPAEVGASTLGGTQKTAKPAPPLTSSMEEIAMKFSESIEKHSKSLNDRKITPRSLLKAEKIQQIYALLEESNGSSLNNLVKKTLERQRQGMKAGDMLELAGGDAARADLILQQSMQHCSDNGDQDSLKRLQECQKDLHTKHGAEVRAGVNTASAIAEFSRLPEVRGQIRNLYYNSILGKNSLANIFDQLLSKSNEDHFYRGFRTLQRALSDDIASASPSRPSGQLHTLLADLNACQKLGSIINASQQFCQRLTSRKFPVNFTPLNLTRQLINFSQSNLYSRDLNQLVEKSAGSDLSHQLTFLNGLLPMVEALPLPIWKDPKSRSSSIKLIRRQMDIQTQREGKIPNTAGP
ncbi:MAG: type III secretion system gatekeeper subunit SctW [Exilibacterium sp.]